jgi:hypothetical protein
MKFALRHANVAAEREGMLLPQAARAMGDRYGLAAALTEKTTDRVWIT